ncbi:unnamed protein product [Ectocarpus sp. 6 AP-2014]
MPEAGCIFSVMLPRFTVTAGHTPKKNTHTALQTTATRLNTNYTSLVGGNWNCFALEDAP